VRQADTVWLCYGAHAWFLIGVFAGRSPHVFALALGGYALASLKQGSTMEVCGISSPSAPVNVLTTSEGTRPRGLSRCSSRPCNG
jgi:hypothetical protein